MKKKAKNYLKYSKKTLGVKTKYSVDFDGVIVRHWCRGLSIPVAKLLARTSITPNMVTVFGFLVTIPAFILFTRGNYWLTLTAGFLALFSYYLDYVDGSLARIKN